MNVREAEEILASRPGPDFPIIGYAAMRPLFKVFMAKGFLEAIELMKPVIEEIEEHHEWVVGLDDEIHSKDCWACKALLGYRKNVLGEKQ